jgi:hypothetical protein
MTDIAINPIHQKIVDILTESMSDHVNSYYFGDPLIFPQSDLPAICISNDNGEVGDESVGEDYHRINLVLTLVVDVRNNFDNVESNAVIGDSLSDRIMWGRDPDTFKLLSDTIIHTLRSHSELGNNAHIDLNTPMVPNFGFVPGKRGENQISWEATLSFSIYFTQLRE